MAPNIAQVVYLPVSAAPMHLSVSLVLMGSFTTILVVQPPVPPNTIQIAQLMHVKHAYHPVRLVHRVLPVLAVHWVIGMVPNAPLVVQLGNSLILPIIHARFAVVNV